jgi:hypothetical protein
LGTLAFFPNIDLYPAADPDSSWRAGLVMAHGNGLRFGRDLVFTYGPLGFVGHPVLWGTRSLLAIAAAILVVGGLILAGVHILRAVLPLPVTVVASGLAVRLGWRYEASIVTPLVFLFLAVTLRHLLLIRVPSWRRCAVSAGIAALFLLTKVDTVTYSGVALLALSMSGPTRPTIKEFAKRTGLIFGVFASVVLVCWLALGQTIASLGLWFGDSLRVAFGFNENMVYRAPPFSPVLAIVATLIVLLLTGHTVANLHRSGLGRGYPTSIIGMFIAGTMWMASKSGFVRFDGHAYRYFWYLGFVVVVLVTTPIAPPVSTPISTSGKPLRAHIFQFARKLGLGGFLAISFAVLICVAGVPGGARLLFRGDGPMNLIRTAEPLVSGTRRAEITRTGTERILKWAELSENEIGALRGTRVHAESEDIALIWALGEQVRWKPNPIMQSTNAYLPRLDDRNAASYADARHGPEMVVYHAVPGDGHHPRFQSPAAVVALICNFVPIVDPNSFSQVLKRSPNRCGAEHGRAAVRGKLGSRLTWKSDPGDQNMVIVGRVQLDRRLTERVSGVLRVRPRSWTYQLGAFDNGGVYRFDPGTASQPHLLSIPECLRVGLPRMDTRTYDSLLIDEDDGAPRIDVVLEVSRIPYRCPGPT